MMERLKLLAGPVGLALILIGGVTYGILYTSGPIAFVPLLVGLALVLFSLVSILREPESHGYRRTARYGMHAGASIVFLAAILILLQTLSARHNTRFDTTKNKRFSLASQTVQILNTLERDVTFTCFFKGTSTGKIELEDLLKEYANINPRITYTLIDPDKDPVTTRRYGVTNYGTIVVESGDVEAKILEITESTITNAILKVTREEKKVVYFLAGHGEKSVTNADTDGYSKLREAIADEHYDVKELLTLREEAIPDDCEILVIAGAEKDLFSRERDVVSRYLSGGGNALILLEPILEHTELETIIADYGIEVGDNVIIDRFGKVLAGNFLTPVVNKYGDHPITNNFSLASFFPQSRTVQIAVEPPPGVIAVEIASTGTTAYAETNIDTLLAGKSQFEGEHDLSGPVHIAVAATRVIEAAGEKDSLEVKRRRSRIVVYGDSDFVNNAYLDLSGNRDLILNTIGWLAEEEDLIAIRPKDPMVQPILLTERQGRVFFWLPVVGLPALAAVLGVIIGIIKRRSA